jgi:uncharacterized protein
MVGLGGAWIARDEGTDTRGIVEAALQSGVRYFDTAGNYKGSEEALGRLLGDVREHVFLATKVDHVDAKGAEADLRESLRRLRTDHVDLLLLHGVGLSGDWQAVDKMLAKDGAVGFLRQAKRQGRTRLIGMSVHPPHTAAMKLLDAADDLDVVMTFVNPMAAAQAGAGLALAQRCQRTGIAVAAMKVLGGDGQLASNYDRAFRFALSVPGVACAVIGAHNGDEVRRAARAAREFRPLTPAEMAEAARAGGKAVSSGARQYRQFLAHFRRDAGAGGPLLSLTVVVPGCI